MASPSTTTATTTSPTLRLRGQASVQASPATPGFPITSDFDASPFKDVQTGHTRTMLPVFASPEEERKYRKEHLALVFRIMHRFKLAEGIAGHCSVRDPVEPDTFWVNPQGKSFARMKQSDLVRCRIADGVMVEGIAPTDASASSIHSQIYRVRGREGPAGIEAIVHVHGPNTKAFSSLGRVLDMISQDACAYHDEMVLVPFGGAVFDNTEGERIASIAGSKRIAILQNHGIVAMGKLSIDEAAWWQINFEMCCQAQLLADAARRPTDPIVEAGPEEIASTKAEMGTPEMGWFSLAQYIEDEEYYSQGEHKL
ncbi:Decarboxylase NovR [Vanrija pseudolonga]|uniref:Decarboxylase NovR n=1 Tax=Vanrija pseudolonga TaxID=143232 RepID=A0AAF0YAI4_9TREE|nr:Decarboxylase NovR [Vanrija pseudolonga]